MLVVTISVLVLYVLGIVSGCELEEVDTASAELTAVIPLLAETLTDEEPDAVTWDDKDPDSVTEATIAEEPESVGLACPSSVTGHMVVDTEISSVVTCPVGQFVTDAGQDVTV
ncbi:hypothetical protein F4810DRAFT_674838 [Camillea tinctor]|nr:hypothetical protein F4810DRAFT_674838 [Camillea tinctor]